LSDGRCGTNLPEGQINWIRDNIWSNKLLPIVTWRRVEAQNRSCGFWIFSFAERIFENAYPLEPVSFWSYQFPLAFSTQLRIPFQLWTAGFPVFIRASCSSNTSKFLQLYFTAWRIRVFHLEFTHGRSRVKKWDRFEFKHPLAEGRRFTVHLGRKSISI